MLRREDQDWNDIWKILWRLSKMINSIWIYFVNYKYNYSIMYKWTKPKKNTSN